MDTPPGTGLLTVTTSLLAGSDEGRTVLLAAMHNEVSRESNRRSYILQAEMPQQAKYFRNTFLDACVAATQGRL